jgi:CBS domain-containing protein
MTQETVEAVVREKPSSELVSVAASATVLEAVDAMSRHDIGAVVILTEDALVGGIFTERDLLIRVVEAGRDPRTTPISLVMTRDVHFVSPATPIDAALSLMLVQRHRHLLVIDGPRVYGLVSMRDLVHRMIQHSQGRFEAAVRQAGGIRPGVG